MLPKRNMSLIDGVLGAAMNIGIDGGKAVVLDTERKHEQDSVFVYVQVGGFPS